MSCNVERHNKTVLKRNNTKNILPFFWEESMGDIKGVFPRKNRKCLKIGGNNRRVFRNFSWTLEWIPERWIELKDNQLVVSERAIFERLVEHGALDRHERLYQKKRAYKELAQAYGRLMYKEQRAMSEHEMAQFEAELGEGARFEFHFVKNKNAPTWKLHRELDFVTNYPDKFIFLIKSQ